MKILFVQAKYVCLLFVTSLFLSVITSCATNLKFANSALVPAARGKVKISKDDNGNYAIDLNILHLTEPNRLNPSKELYVVWMDTENNGTKNIGQLKSGTSFFSSTLKASFHTITSFKPTRVFITAENNGAIQTPGPDVVITTNSR